MSKNASTSRAYVFRSVVDASPVPHARTTGTCLKLPVLPFSDADEIVCLASLSMEECADLPMQAQEQSIRMRLPLMPIAPFAELKIPKASDYVGMKRRGQFACGTCSRSYTRKDSLQRHMHWECGKDPQFHCPFCPQRCKRKAHWMRHIRRQHPMMMDSEDMRCHTPKIEVD